MTEPTFTTEQEHEHNQRLQDALASFYHYRLMKGDTARADHNFRRYMAFLREFTIGLDTDNVK